MDNINIGIMGLEFNNKNKGCEALSYSFANMLNEIAEKNNIHVNLFLIRQMHKKEFLKNYCRLTSANDEIREKYGSRREYSNIDFFFAFYVEKNGHSIRSNKIKELDFIIDFKYGDSFTDIYGYRRFNNGCASMEMFLHQKIKLVFGSQTIGPFQNEEHISRAAKILENSEKVYVRDKMSFDYVREISRAEPVLTTDIAFMLPYEKKEIKDKRKKRIGLNVSGLLWCGGYTKDNQFDLTIDYKEYTYKLVSYLRKKEDIDVILIPHVIDKIVDGEIDNDMIAMRDLMNKYPDIKMYDGKADPIELKSYISGLDLLIGGRMHATIAAFSSGVPVIPVSYSRKFEGLYESLNYNYIIHGKLMSAEEAYNKTIYYIENIDELLEAQKIGLNIANSRKEFFTSEFEKYIIQICAKRKKQR